MVVEDNKPGISLAVVASDDEERAATAFHASWKALSRSLTLTH